MARSSANIRRLPHPPTAGAATPVALTPVAGATAQATVALTAPAVLAATAQSRSAATAATTATAWLTPIAGATAAAASTVSAASRLTATAGATAQATAAITTTAPLTPTAQGATQATAAVQAPALVTASANATAAASGATTAASGLVATAQAAGQAQATVNTTAPIVAAAQAAATASATVTAPTAATPQPLTPVAQAAAQAQAIATTTAPLIATAQASCQATGQVTTTAPITASAAAATAATSLLTAQAALVATGQVASAAIATVTTTAPLSATAQVTARAKIAGDVTAASLLTAQAGAQAAATASTTATAKLTAAAGAAAQASVLLTAPALLGGAGAAPAGAIVQHASAYGGSGAVSTLGVTLPNPTTPGNQIVVFIGYKGPTTDVITAVDGDPDSVYRPVPGAIATDAGSLYSMQALQGRVHSAGTRTVTITDTTSARNFVRLYVVEVAGVNNVDTALVVNNGGATSAIDAGSLAVNHPGEIALAFVASGNGVTSAGSGWTALEVAGSELVMGATGLSAPIEVVAPSAGATWCVIALSYWQDPKPIFIQAASAFQNSYISVDAEMDLPMERDNTVMAFCSWTGAAGTGWVFFDAVGSVFHTLDQGFDTTLGFQGAMAWAKVAAPTGHGVEYSRAVVDGGDGSTANFLRLMIIEYANVDTTIAPTVFTDFNNAAATDQTLPATTAHPNAVIVGQDISNDGTGPSGADATAGSVRRATSGSESSYDALAPTAGTYTVGFISHTSCSWFTEAAAFYGPAVTIGGGVVAQATTQATATVTATAAPLLTSTAQARAQATAAVTAPAALVATAQNKAQAQATVATTAPLIATAQASATATVVATAAALLTATAQTRAQATAPVTAPAALSATAQATSIAVAQTTAAAVLVPTAAATAAAGSYQAVAADDFNRADGGLGTGWTAFVGGTDTPMAIVSNQARASAASGVWSGSYRTDSYGNDQFAQIDVAATPGPGDWIGVTLRTLTNGQNGYRFIYFNNGGTYELRIGTRASGTGGTLTTLSLGATPLPIGTTLRLAVIGTFFRLFQNGVPVLAATDSTFLAGGPPGLITFNSTASITGAADNYLSGNAVLTAPVPITAASLLSPVAGASAQAVAPIAAAAQLTGAIAQAASQAIALITSGGAAIAPSAQAAMTATAQATARALIVATAQAAGSAVAQASALTRFTASGQATAAAQATVTTTAPLVASASASAQATVVVTSVGVQNLFPVAQATASAASALTAAARLAASASATTAASAALTTAAQLAPVAQAISSASVAAVGTQAWLTPSASASTQATLTLFVPGVAFFTASASARAQATATAIAPQAQFLAPTAQATTAATGSSTARALLGATAQAVTQATSLVTYPVKLTPVAASRTSATAASTAASLLSPAASATAKAGRPPVAGLPKVSSLVDTFDSGLDLATWDPNGDVSVVNGRLVLDATADYSGIFSHNLYDATESSLSAELVSGSAAFPVVLNDVTNADHYVYWWLQDGFAQAWYKDHAMVADAMLWQGPYDPVAYRFFRIREHAGRTFWEHSPDGYAWATDYDTPDLMDMTAMQASHFGVPPAIVTLDNVNWPSDEPAVVTAPTLLDPFASTATHAQARLQTRSMLAPTAQAATAASARVVVPVTLVASATCRMQARLIVTAPATAVLELPLYADVVSNHTYAEVVDLSFTLSVVSPATTVDVEDPSTGATVILP